MHTKKSRVYAALSAMGKLKWSVALKGVLTGFIAGLLVVFYRYGIEWGTETAVRLYAHIRTNLVLIIPWLAAAILLSLVIARLLRWEPMATGSGIPQVEGLLLYGMKMRWYTILAVRYLTGILSSFFGLSMGREGPSIQIGASGSQAVAKKLGSSKLEENYLITGGAAAGLSAAFNAPLSGIVFALEEVHRSFSPLILIAATTASLMADIVSKYFFGLKPVLSFQTVPQLPAVLYVWLIPVGILSGLTGSAINKLLLASQKLYGKLPQVFRPLLALVIALPCGLFLPQILGGGQNLISLAENPANLGIAMLCLLLLGKMLFSSTSFGSGIPGGIFMPILSVGALTGCIFGRIGAHFGLPEVYIVDFTICAMAGALSGSVKAPVTSILLTVELTGSLVHMLPVAACSFIAMFTSDLLHVSPIYEELLGRIMEKTGERREGEKRGALLEVAVEMGSEVAEKLVSEVGWPEGALVVSIRRGVKEIVPHGDTQILQGDYLLIASTKDRFRDLNVRMRELCHAKPDE